MKTKVVQHVPRIIFHVFKVFKTFLVPRFCLDIQTFFSLQMEEDTDCVSPWRVPKPRRPIDESESFPSQSPPYVPIPTGSQPKRLQVGIAYVPPTDRVMTDPASDQDGISPWRAAKPRRPIYDDQDSPPTRLFASPPPPLSGRSTGQ